MGELSIHKACRSNYQSLREAIKTVKPGSRLGDIGAAIQEVVEPHGYSIVEDIAVMESEEFHKSPK